MNTIFRAQVRAGHFSIYMDDGVIHTKRLYHETEEQHVQRHRRFVHEIFDILAKHDLYLKPEKCQFEQTSIEFLGVIVGDGQLKMDPKKLAGVADWKPPTTPTEIRKFLGFTGYYRYFVPNYSKIARPLLALTHKEKIWSWGEEQTRAFEELKTRMCASPVLRQPDFDKRFYL